MMMQKNRERLCVVASHWRMGRESVKKNSSSRIGDSICARRIRQIVIGIMALGFAAAVLADEERLDIDPVVQGIWTALAVSEDGGKTVTLVTNPEVIARVRATQATTVDGKILHVDKVLISKDVAGYPMNTIFFTNGVIWAVSKQPGSMYVLVQVFEPAVSTRERIRFLVVVNK